MNDIDLTAEFLPGGAFHNGGQGWIPIGTSSANSFAGTFDGHGNAIIGIFINRISDYQALFGYTGSCTIRSIAVEDVDVTGANIAGSLVGLNRGDVLDARSTGTVSGGYRVGGLVGENNPGTVSASSSSATIQANDGRIGGLVGFNVGGTVVNCFATGQVTGGWYVGGLIGRNLNGTVTQSFATGNVISTSVAGGLVGDTEGGTISNCYATGSAQAVNWFGGGLIGYLWTTAVSNSFSTGFVSGGEDIGGLVGYRFGGSVSGSYWNTETSGQSVSAGGMGRTTEEMTYPYAANTYTGWAFGTIWEEDTTGGVNSGYPYLYWQIPEPASAPEPSGPAVLIAGYPNPFTERATIAFRTHRDGPVTLSVYDVAGGLVKTLLSDRRPAGAHHVHWDGSCDRGRRVAGGVYLYRLRCEGGTAGGKIALRR
ncbi:MAG: hypothetical protein FJY75_03165 [Candidatus Eisenbacteria bacterium]|uniref:T9SS type A sorting domain-containing protein n=1 Tax=Eiseniibacteriota bacterium TaxID=2212470 RepID=A0A938BQF9_UNCEI|nr:hypothetical protein [Candidatus Eisenbacteria bacterium]